MKTFKVLSDFDADGVIPLCCPKCESDALCPTHGDPGTLIIAVIGLGLVCDPPGDPVNDDYLPDVIQCRQCRTIWESKNVRQVV